MTDWNNLKKNYLISRKIKRNIPENKREKFEKIGRVREKERREKEESVPHYLRCESRHVSKVYLYVYLINYIPY